MNFKVNSKVVKLVGSYASLVFSLLWEIHRRINFAKCFDIFSEV